MTPEEELRRASRAKQILNDEIFSEAVTTVKNALIEGIVRTAFVDEKLREKLCQRLAVVDSTIALIESTMQTGEFAQAEIERLSLIDRAKEFFNG